MEILRVNLQILYGKSPKYFSLDTPRVYTGQSVRNGRGSGIVAETKGVRVRGLFKHVSIRRTYYSIRVFFVTRRFLEISKSAIQNALCPGHDQQTPV